VNYDNEPTKKMYEDASNMHHSSASENNEDDKDYVSSDENVGNINVVSSKKRKFSKVKTDKRSNKKKGCRRR